jgi:hypothetical protein
VMRLLQDRLGGPRQRGAEDLERVGHDRNGPRDVIGMRADALVSKPSRRKWWRVRTTVCTVSFFVP